VIDTITVPVTGNGEGRSWGVAKIGCAYSSVERTNIMYAVSRTVPKVPPQKANGGVCEFVRLSSDYGSSAHERTKTTPLKD